MMKTQENIFLVSASVHDSPLSECGHYLRLLCCVLCFYLSFLHSFSLYFTNITGS